MNPSTPHFYEMWCYDKDEQALVCDLTPLGKKFPTLTALSESLEPLWEQFTKNQLKKSM